MARSDEIMLEANQRRFADEKASIATRLRDLANEIDRIPLEKHGGGDRNPVAVLGQITQTLLFGVANLKLDSLAIWAEGIIEARDYLNQKEV